MRFLLFLYSLLIAPTLSLSADAAGHGSVMEPLDGGWGPIENVSEPHAQEISKFAVDEHNKNTRNPLRLINVTNGDMQIVAGFNYRLIITAADGVSTGTAGEYEATVWEKSWKNLMKLTSFKPLRS